MSQALRISRLLLQAASEGPALVRSHAIKAPPPPLAALQHLYVPYRLYATGSAGSGAGKGGGSGGSIRDAGGKFGEMESAREEDHFRREQSRQIKDLREVMQRDLDHLITYHTQQMSRHIAGIKMHTELIAKGRDPEVHNEHISQHDKSRRAHKDRIAYYEDRKKKLAAQLKEEEEKKKKC